MKRLVIIVGSVVAVLMLLGFALGRVTVPDPAVLADGETPVVVATPTAVATVVVQASLMTCTKHGTVAWHADNLQSGALYGEAPVGGLDEPCGVVAQTWTTQGETERFVFYVPSKSVAWLSGHRGGTGWYFDPNQDVAADLQKQVWELEARDGEMKTTVAILPEQAFRLVTRVQSSELAQTPSTVVAPTTAPSDTSATVASCNIGGESVGPAILEGEVLGKATVVKLNTGQKYSLSTGGCWTLSSQTELDARWDAHKSEFLAKYPAGQAVEK